MKRDTLKFYLGLFFIVGQFLYSQNNERKYYFIDYHSSVDVGLNYNTIKILGSSGIDPDNSGKIDYKRLDESLNKFFPEENGFGILCIDIENQIYTNLRDNSMTSNRGSTSINEFIGLLDYISTKRPNLKIGIYALPFPFYFKNQKVRNEEGKFDEILSRVDFIFPSLYLYYPSDQKGIEANYRFLSENLKLASLYAERYNKEVIPFVWYLIHPSNKKYRYAMINKFEMKKYINFIWNYSRTEFELKGILIWNSPTPFRSDEVNTILLQDDVKINNTIDAINYYKLIF